MKTWEKCPFFSWTCLRYKVNQLSSWVIIYISLIAKKAEKWQWGGGGGGKAPSQPLPLNRRSGPIWAVLIRSALVNIRRKALLSSVTFRKRMTSRSPLGSPFDSCKLRFDRPLRLVWWSDVCFEVLSCFFDHPPMPSSSRCHCICLEGCFNVSPRSSLLAHQEGPFSGCYWVTSLEWPQIQWHSWRNYTNKQIKLKWTAASFNNFFKYWREC